MAEQDQLKKVVDIISGSRFAMVTSRTADGHLVSRPLSLQETEFDGDLWFFVDRQADLLVQITMDPRVNVSVTGDGSWVSVAGRAEVVQDEAKAQELWNPYVAAWFAAEGSTDADAKDAGPAELGAVLVKVDGDTAEYWQSSGKVATAVSLVKARLTGGGATVTGENEVVELP
ncbi:pyridoxamine 5'-phosphate oxidase family protein [Auraticoccus monumenti]|uniref:General stress protein 26 n=1 Tax=Auraticoccus monumenti TaxID=675864 RepID=A0A1G6VXJ3_9ACTN|nr:pyridoxamine 5'-phosphate oxidase family protein [Auraticoccus monumenti]SDD58143.1 General stress protein 26 [Auraticoccus monumenti]